MREKEIKEKKGSPFLTTLVIILTIMVIGLAGFIVYDKYVKKTTTVKTTQQNCKKTTTTVETKTTTVDKAKVKAAYNSVLKGKYEENYEAIQNDTDNWFHNYGLFDIDQDGTQELIIQLGTCEADTMVEFFTYKNDSIIYLGTLSGGHTGYYTTTDKYIIFEFEHMGYEAINHISIKDNTITSEKISDRQISASEDYKKFDNRLKTVPLNDTSLIDNM